MGLQAKRVPSHIQIELERRTDMKRIGLAGLVVYTLLLLAIQGASAQDGRPGCLDGPDAAAEAISKPAGLGRPIPAISPKLPATCGSGENPDVLPVTCLDGPGAAAETTSKTAGLARAIPATSPKQPASCGSGENPDVLPVACLDGPGAAAEAVSKPAGLARPIPATSPKQPASCGSGENPDVLPVTCLDGPGAAAEISLNACRAGAMKRTGSALRRL